MTKQTIKLATTFDPAISWWENAKARSTRVIPVLLLRGAGFVKTIKFKNPTYVGDPVNIVKIFNEKQADEIVILDIEATRQRRAPNFELLADIASECFMPLAYGGGVRTLDDIQQLTCLGMEKVCINTAAHENASFIRNAVEQFGSSTIVVSIDARETWFGKHQVVTRCGKRRTALAPVDAARMAVDNGAGELLINSITRDGTMQGYDLPLIEQIAESVDVPVVACGGAAGVMDFRNAVVDCGASAVAAGSMFIFHGPHRAVLINMPEQESLAEAGIP